MKKILSAIAAAFLLMASPAQAVDSTVSALTAASAFSGAELLYVVQSAADRKGTPAQMATYVYSLMSGDCSMTGSVITCTKINGVTFPASGTSGGIPYFSAAGAISSSAALTANLPVIGGGAGVAPAVGTRSGNTTGFTTFTGTVTGGTNCAQWDINGNLTTAASSCGSSGATGANPTATAGPAAVNGVSTNFLRADGAPAVQQGSSSQKGIVQVDGTTITESSGVISSAPITAVPSVQSGTNYAFQSTDRGKVIYLNNAAAQTPTIAQAGTGGFTNGWYATACNIAAGAQTITPSTSTIGGASTYVLTPGAAGSPRCITIISDGTNYVIVPSGNTYTIASGTAALGTSAIGSAACATAVTVSAPSIVTTDVVIASFNGDPTAVTGYVPLTTGMLTIIPYPTANNVNFKVCNNSSASITPGAITLNWRVAR